MSTTYIPEALRRQVIERAQWRMDRVAGYGLKYPTEFKDTHMQRV